MNEEDLIPPPPLPPALSLKPDPLTGLVHISAAPGTTIKTAGPPPSAFAQFVALVPDMTAMLLIAGVGGWQHWSAQVVVGGITGILLLRIKPSQPGEQATSGVFGAVEALVRGLKSVRNKVKGKG